MSDSNADAPSPQPIPHAPAPMHADGVPPAKKGSIRAAAVAAAEAIANTAFQSGHIPALLPPTVGELRYHYEVAIASWGGGALLLPLFRRGGTPRADMEGPDAHPDVKALRSTIRKVYPGTTLDGAILYEILADYCPALTPAEADKLTVRRLNDLLCGTQDYRPKREESKPKDTPKRAEGGTPPAARPDPNRPGKDRQRDIIATITSKGTPLTRPELVDAMRLQTEGKLGPCLAWMTKNKILVNIRGQGYWPADLPMPE